MHRENIYKEGVDFQKLAGFNKDLKQHVIDGRLDFSIVESNLSLTKALLKVDWALDLDLPNDRLCPGVPGRLDYLLWLRDLERAVKERQWVFGSAGFAQESTESEIGVEPCSKRSMRMKSPDVSDYSLPPVSLLDIGTGASAIYTLLGSRLWSGHLMATEINAHSFAYAAQNIKTNLLSKRTLLFDASLYNTILPDLSGRKVMLQCCNPPFFASREEMQIGLDLKHNLPASICTGSTSEMICPGGEVDFVTRLIIESVEKQAHVCWFSSLLGKRSSVPKIVTQLRMHGIDNFVVGVVDVGRTKRWTVAWSFEGYRLDDGMTQIDLGLNALRPTSSLLRRVFDLRLVDLNARLKEVLSMIHLAVQSAPVLRVIAYTPSWTRAERRKTQTQDTNNTPILACQLFCVSSGPGQSALTIEWIYGQKRMFFESFASHCFGKILATR